MIGLEQKFVTYLHPGEEVLWTGQPARGVTTSHKDAFDSLLGIGAIIVVLWLGALIIPSIAAYPWLGLLLLVLIIALWGAVYSVVVRFILQKRIKSQTFYAITNKRVLMLFDGRIKKLIDIFLILWCRGHNTKLVELPLSSILSLTIQSYHEGVALIFTDGLHFFLPPYRVCPSDEAPRDVDLIEYLDDSSSEPWGTWLKAFAFCGIDVEEAERIKALVREYQEPAGNITFDLLATIENTDGDNGEYFSFEY